MHFEVVVHVSFFFCEIFTDFYEVHATITYILEPFQDEHLLDWSNFILLDYPYIIFRKSG